MTTAIQDILQELDEDRRRYKDLALNPSIVGRFGVHALRARIREIDRLYNRLQALQVVERA